MLFVCFARGLWNSPNTSAFRKKSASVKSLAFFISHTWRRGDAVKGGEAKSRTLMRAAWSVANVPTLTGFSGQGLGQTCSFLSHSHWLLPPHFGCSYIVIFVLNCGHCRTPPPLTDQFAMIVLLTQRVVSVSYHVYHNYIIISCVILTFRRSVEQFSFGLHDRDLQGTATFQRRCPHQEAPSAQHVVPMSRFFPEWGFRFPRCFWFPPRGFRFPGCFPTNVVGTISGLCAFIWPFAHLTINHVTF